MSADHPPPITDYLHPEAVCASLDTQNKDEALASLAACLGSLDVGINQEAVLACLREREALGSTAIGDGVAIPHGKLPGLEKAHLALVRCPLGIGFGSPDESKVKLLLAIVTPTENPTLHLKILARVSRLLGRPVLREALLEATDADSMYQIIRDADASL